MKRSTQGITLAAAAAIAASSGLAIGGGGQRLTPNTLALQRGCRTGGFQEVNSTNPSWVSVEPTEKAKAIEGIVRVSKVTSEDYPANHESHDWNLFVKPDPQYESMNGDANHKFDSDGREIPENQPGGDRCMEVEWETKHFDMQFWPVVGDRVTALGRWIFDCGHPPYRTEIHPPKFIASTRLSPHTFAGDPAPSYTNKAFVFINGQGGYYYDHIGGTKYTFDVQAPSRPAGATATAAEFRAQVLSLPFGGPTPTLTPMPEQNKVRVTYDLSAVNDPPRWNLYQHQLSLRPTAAPKFGAVIAAGWREPVLTRGYRVLRVNFESVRINSDHDPIPFNSGDWRMWAHANGTWFQVPGMGDVDDGETVSVNRSIILTVPEDGEVAIQTTGWESDEIDEHFRMDSPGALPITASSRGLFSKIKKAAKKVGGAVASGAKKVGGAVASGAKAAGGAVVSGAKAAGGAVKDAAVAVKDKVVEEIKDAINNEPIGTVKARFTAADNFGIGRQHDQPSTSGDYRLRFRIEELKRIPAGTPNGPAAPR